ncbi:MAG: glycosyl transferase [Candidatus Rokuibacteriota bacterium]|nr:MAG: glycosyl transferase [Candidatus Rokubacteria bacterium]
MTAGQGLLAATALAGALWRALRVVSVLGRMGRLPRVADAPPPSGAPLVSVLVPARNEERNLAACLASLSAQSYPSLEIVVVDDGSTDRTPALAAAAAARDPRVVALRVDGPAPGWTGKNYALAAGVAWARGTWLCFTDADTLHMPTSIERALGFAQARGLGLLSMTSRQLTLSFWERVVQPVVFGLLDQWFPLARVNDPVSPVAAANGIFLLVRRDAYEEVGGHQAVRGDVLEDVALARNTKRSGHRLAFADGADLVAVRMYTGLGGIRRGWTKNLYALRDRRADRALASAAELFLTAVWPLLAALLAAVAGLPGAGAALVATGVVLALEAPFRARRGFDPAWSLTLPLGAALVLGFLLESAVRAWLGLGVSWKDRRYT